MKATILAAGLGTRLRDLTSQTPKCLFAIRDRSILEYQIKVLKKSGVRDISLVIGTKGSVWNQESYEYINKICKKEKIRTILNFDNDKTQNSYSLFLAMKSVKITSLLAIDGDIVFNRNFLTLACESPHKTLILSRRTNNLSEPGTRVTVNENGKVIDVGKNILPSAPYWHIYSGLIKIGLDHFDKFEKILSKEKYRPSDLSYPLKEFSSRSEFYSVEVNKGWVNVNTPQDLKRARQLLEDVSK